MIKLFHYLIALGIDDTNDNEFVKFHKSLACKLNGFLFTLLLVNVIVSIPFFDNNPVYVLLCAVTLLSTICNQCVYATFKTTQGITIVCCVLSLLLGPVLSIDDRISGGGGGVFNAYRGVWFAPQMMLLGIARKMGASTRWIAWIGTCNVATFVIITSTEDNILSFVPQKVLIFSIVNLVVPLTIATVLYPLFENPKQEEEHRVNVTVGGEIRNEIPNTITTENMIEFVDLMSTSQHKTGGSGSSSARNTLEAEVGFSLPESGVRSGSTASNTSVGIVINDIPRHDSSSDSVAGSTSLFEMVSRDHIDMSSNHSGSSSSTKNLLMFREDSTSSSSRVMATFGQACTLVVVEPKLLSFELVNRSVVAPRTILEKYATNVWRCVLAYFGNVVWVSGTEITIQFSGTAQYSNAVMFCQNVNDLCSKHALLSLTCVITCGDIIGHRVFLNTKIGSSQMVSRQATSANPLAMNLGSKDLLERCRVMMSVLYDKKIAIGCDSTLLGHLPRELIQPLVDTIPTLDMTDITAAMAEPPSPSPVAATTYFKIVNPGHQLLEYKVVNDDSNKIDTPTRTGSTESSESNPVLVVTEPNNNNNPAEDTWGKISFSQFKKTLDVMTNATTDEMGSSGNNNHQRNTLSPNNGVGSGSGKKNKFDGSGSFEIVFSTSHRKTIKLEKSMKASSGRGRTASLSPPVNLPQDAWEAWLKMDTHRTGVLSADEVWKLLRHRLDLNILPERFFDFLEKCDTDGSCTISLQEFAEAYDGFLSGMVLMSRVRRFGEGLSDQGFDPYEHGYDAWIGTCGKHKKFVNADIAVQVMHNLGVEATEQQVLSMLTELDGDEGKRLHINDFLALFLPEVSAENVARLERIESVTRVANSNFEENKKYETDAQRQQRQAEVNARRYDFYASLIMLPYVLYSSIEATVCSALWYHEDVRNTERTRSILATVLLVIPILWVVTKLWNPKEIRGRYVICASEIRKHYLCSLDVIVDVIGILPLDLVAVVVDDEVYGSLYRLHRIALLYYVNTFYNYVTRDLNASLCRIILTFLWWCLGIHSCGCIFLSLIPSETTSDIITIENLLHQSAAYMYFQSYDWAIKLMVGLNRGAPLPTSDACLGLSLAVVTIGVVVFSVIVTTIGNALNVRDASAMFADKLEETRAFFEEVNVSKDLTEDVIHYYRHMFQTYGTTKPSENPIMDLPQELDVLTCIGHSQRLLQNVSILAPIFRNPAAVYELNRVLRPVVFLPGEFVCRKGSPVLSMYIVTYGIAHRGEKKNDVIRQGDTIHEYALLHNLQALYNVRAASNVYLNTMEVRKVDFVYILSMFPEMTELVKDRIFARIEDTLLVQCKNSKKSSMMMMTVEDFLRYYEAKETATSMHFDVCSKLT